MDKLIRLIAKMEKRLIQLEKDMMKVREMYE